MNYLDQFISKLRWRVFVVIFTGSLIITTFSWLIFNHTSLAEGAKVAAVVIFGFHVALIASSIITGLSVKPLRAIWQAVWHISPNHNDSPAPDLNNLRLGRELVTSLCSQIYQLASADVGTAHKDSAEWAKVIIGNLPLPVFALDSSQNLVYTNQAAVSYTGLAIKDIVGKNAYSVLNLSFSSNDTFDKWLNESKNNTVTAAKSWDRVRLTLPEHDNPLQFDMAAYFNKGGAAGIETIIIMFDHTKRYQEDDGDIALISLAVHELRTPLTMLRGYIEVFEEELEGKLDNEMADFLRKMRATAQQLTVFVNNILNVARIEADQLILQLKKESWATIVQSAINDLALRAQVHNKQIAYSIEAGLPDVAVDRVSIYEVINNLIDNAIKYGGKSQRIEVKSYRRKDGLIETTVRDYGVGIAGSVLPHVFEKFYRSHHTKSQTGGTGLGLYLSKAIIEAHGGTIWVRSKEGQGAIFGFSVKPYDSLAAEQKTEDNDIVRGAHGWIKNHSLYRDS